MQHIHLQRNTIAWMIGLLCSASTFASTVTWYQSGYDETTNSIANWQQKQVQAEQPNPDTDYRVIDLTKAQVAQKFDGFGGAFNEKGWDAMSALKADARQDVLNHLFNQKQGLGLVIGRIPIGASDYAMDYYSHDDHPGDYAMRYFSINRDRKYLIPYIKAAQDVQPKLTFFASPWTPPAWMKANQHYACRADKANAHLIWKPEVEKAYALYFSKFVKAYGQEQIPISALHLQNEPAGCQDFPSSLWTGPQMRDFLRDYLVPQFEQDKLNTQLWLGTINQGDYTAYAKPVLDEPKLKGKIAGIGYQWDGKYAIADTHKHYPNIKLIQTESECGNGSNDIVAGLYTFSLIQKYLDAGASAYVYWNMVLDSSGNSSWGWKQNSLISVDRINNKVNYNMDYFVMQHFSHFVQPGAHLLKTAYHEDTLSFRNPDGSYVVVAANPSYSVKEITMKVGDQTVRAKLPMMTIHSFTIQP